MEKHLENNQALENTNEISSAENSVETPESSVNEISKSSEEETSSLETPAAAAEVETPTTEVEIDALVETLVQQQKEYLETKSELSSTDESEESEDELEEVEINLENLSKKELVSLLQEKLSDGNASKIDAIAKKIKSAFDGIRDGEKAEALAKYLEENGSEEDFDFQGDEHDRSFDELFNKFRERRANERAEQERSKENNLAKKEEILEKLRHLVDSEETISSLNALQKIQEEWKQIGPVPNSKGRELANNYSALISRFYDNRSIYFELKDLDRKKNLEKKKEIIERAEKLLGEESLNAAVKGINELLEEFKTVGPPPKEDQETIWAQFKAIADQIFEKRRAYIESQRESQLQNLEVKKRLMEKLSLVANVSSDRINDWTEAAKVIEEIRGQWQEIGQVPKEEGGTINKDFWGVLKAFYASRSAFLTNLEKQRTENYAKKIVLCERAESLKDSEEWVDTTKELIKLQEDWKGIGPVPKKYQDKIYARFKAAVDHFFDRRNQQNNSQYAAEKENLAAKKAIIEKIEAGIKGKSIDLDQLEALGTEFNGIGFVPRRDIETVQKGFQTAIDNALKALGVDDTTKASFLQALRPSRGGAQGGRNNTGGQNRGSGKPNGAWGMKKKIEDLENQIYSYTNNLAFFANSRNADSIKKEVESKISKLRTEVDALKLELKKNQESEQNNLGETK